MSVLIEIDKLPRGRRLDTWRHALKKTVVVRHGSSAQGQIALSQAGEVGMFAIKSISQTLERTDLCTKDGADSIFAGITLRGRGTALQDNRAVNISPGSIAFYDASRPYLLDFTEDYQVLAVQLPRDRFMSRFGSTSLYTNTLIDEANGGAAIGVFFRELARTVERMTPALAGSLASLGVDLLVEGLAGKLAEEPVVPLLGALTMHRIKSFVDAHLGDSGLDPPAMAAAGSVTMERLYQLFRDAGETPASYLWRRRLDLARSRLAHVASGGQTIGAIAWSCGFVSQAHFSRRFKEAFGETPIEWRRRCKGAAA